MTMDVKQTMRAAVYREPGVPLVIEPRKLPVISPGRVLIKVDYCGICGTDLHASLSPPQTSTGELVLGHEYVGKVVATGDGVALTIGDNVCALPFLACGQCEACLQGLSFECGEKDITGLTVDGAFAEYVEAAADEVLVLPETIQGVKAALIEPLAVAWHAIKRLGTHLPKRVVIVGGGAIGMAVIYWCYYLGCRDITLIETNASREDLAKHLGATTVTIRDKDAEISFIEKGSVIFECVGLPGVIQQCIDMAPRKSCIVIVGFCDVQDQWLPTSALLKELSFEFAVAYSRSDFTEVIAQLEHANDPTAMITSIIAMAQLPEVFEGLKRSGSDCKVLVDCQT